MDLNKRGYGVEKGAVLYYLQRENDVSYRMEEDYIARNLLETKEKLPVEVRNMGYRQMSLFDDVRFRENVML